MIVRPDRNNVVTLMFKQIEEHESAEYSTSPASRSASVYAERLADIDDSNGL